MLHVGHRVGHVVTLRPQTGNALKTLGLVFWADLTLLIQKLVYGSTNQLTFARRSALARLAEACLLLLCKVNLRSGESLICTHDV